MTDPAPTGEPTIAITRVFDAPRERVWEQWTTPKAFAGWYGGPEADNPLDTVSMDVREGGAWRLTMFHGPERRRIDWHGAYREIREPERLVLTITDLPEGEAEYALLIVELDDLGDGRTEMRMEQHGPMPPEQAKRAREGWGGFFDTLADRLSASSGPAPS